MNTEINYPVYPELVVGFEDAEIFVKSFYFDLNLGTLVLNCFIDNLDKVETKFECNTDSNPENDADREAFYFKADLNKHKIYVDGGDLDFLGLVKGQCLKLTKEQECSINEYLEENFEWV